MPRDRSFEVIAHRGYSAVAPENTLAALRRAVDAGADAVEFDFRFSADGVPVAIHDETLDRTTDGSGPVRDASWAGIRELDAGSWFGPTFAGEPVPSVADALEAVRGRVRRVYAELKGWRSAADAARVVDVLGEGGWADDAVLISLDWAKLAAVRAVDPALRIGFIVDAGDDVEEAVERAAADGRALVDLAHTLVLERPARAAGARERGVECAVWTVDREVDARAMVDAGVRRITTNEVERMVRLARR